MKNWSKWAIMTIVCFVIACIETYVYGAFLLSYYILFGVSLGFWITEWRKGDVNENRSIVYK